MINLNVPKRVTLPNGRTFGARYKRIRRTYTQKAAPKGRRPRRAQQGQGIFDFAKK